ncbi:MAG: hypothetical protein ACYC9S_03560 [Leptospirales bacterium]
MDHMEFLSSREDSPGPGRVYHYPSSQAFGTLVGSSSTLVLMRSPPTGRKRRGEHQKTPECACFLHDSTLPERSVWKSPIVSKCDRNQKLFHVRSPERSLLYSLPVDNRKYPGKDRGLLLFPHGWMEENSGVQ